MNIDPKVEPWLIALLDGVQNSNHRAETTATAAYAVPALVKALQRLSNETGALPKMFEPEIREATGNSNFGCIQGAVEKAAAALALARGETP